MFAIDCSHCGNRSLIFESQVRGIRNDETGIHVEVACWCGAVGEIHTGRAAAAKTPAIAA
jgi:hypothetical protein